MSPEYSASEPCTRVQKALFLLAQKQSASGVVYPVPPIKTPHEYVEATRGRRSSGDEMPLKSKLFLTRFAALLLVTATTLATLYGISNHDRARKAEQLLKDRSANLTNLGASLAETNAAYGRSLDELGKSRAAADRFYARLTILPPLSGEVPSRQPEPGNDWLRFAKNYYAATIDSRTVSWDAELVSARANHGLARAAAALGDGDTAARHFREAVSTFENIAEKRSEGDLHAEYFGRIGDCYQQLWSLEPIAREGASFDLLRRATGAFQKALELQPDDVHLIVKAATAYFLLGSHQSECHLQQPALDSFVHSLRLLARVGNQRELREEEQFLAARAYTSSGALLRELNRGPAALDAQVMSLEILLDLTEKSPHRINFDVELARCYRELGELFQFVKDEEDAPRGDPRQMLTEANRILLSVMADSPDHPVATRYLARIYMDQAKLDRGTERDSETLKLAGKAADLLAGLVCRYPENPKYPFYLAEQKIDSMHLLAAAKDSQEALELGEEAREILEILIADHRGLTASPVMKKYRRTLAELYGQLGSLTEKQSGRELAAAYYAKAIGSWELLAADYDADEEIGDRLEASRKSLDQIHEPGGGRTLAQNPNDKGK